jgi:hypothetical protein
LPNSTHDEGHSQQYRLVDLVADSLQPLRYVDVSRVEDSCLVELGE